MYGFVQPCLLKRIRIYKKTNDNIWLYSYKVLFRAIDKNGVLHWIKWKLI
jgi:hypothetical protein